MTQHSKFSVLLWAPRCAIPSVPRLHGSLLHWDVSHLPASARLSFPLIFLPPFLPSSQLSESTSLWARMHTSGPYTWPWKSALCSHPAWYVLPPPPISPVSCGFILSSMSSFGARALSCLSFHPRPPPGTNREQVLGGLYARYRCPSGVEYGSAHKLASFLRAELTSGYDSVCVTLGLPTLLRPSRTLLHSSQNTPLPFPLCHLPRNVTVLN